MPHIEETEKEEAAQEKREQPRGNRLEKKKTAKRDLCVKKKIERREQSVAALRKIFSAYESKEKQERDFSLAVRHIQEILFLI